MAFPEGETSSSGSSTIWPRPCRWKSPAVGNYHRHRAFGRKLMESAPKRRPQARRRRPNMQRRKPNKIKKRRYKAPCRRRPLPKRRRPLPKQRRRIISKPKLRRRPAFTNRRQIDRICPYHPHVQHNYNLMQRRPSRPCKPPCCMHNRKIMHRCCSTASSKKKPEGGGFFNFLRFFRNLRKNLPKDQTTSLGVEAWCNLTESERNRFEGTSWKETIDK